MTAELRSIYSGPVRRALERLNQGLMDIPPEGSTFVQEPAYAGPRTDIPSNARFGHTGLTNGIGFIAAPSGTNLVVAGSAQPFQLWQANAPVTAYTQYADMTPTKLSYAPWVLGAHTLHGPGSPGLWLSSTDGSAEYVLLRQGSDTYVNCPAGGIVGLRVNNADLVRVGETLVVLNRSTQVNGDALTVVPAGGFYAPAIHANHGQIRASGGAADENWNNAHFLADSNKTYAHIALYSSGFAPQIRVASTVGEVVEFVNSTNTTYIPINASAFVVSSSATLKHRIRTLRPKRERIRVNHNPMSDVVPEPDVMALRPVAFRPKVPPMRTVPEGGAVEEPTDTALGRMGRRERLGLIAEDVQHVIPSAVARDVDGNPTGIDYAQVTVALLDHVQRLTETVETLQYRVTELEETNA